MPTSAEELIDLLDLEQIDINLFRGRQPQTLMQRVFGGQVAGQSLVAAARTAPDDRHVHSLHSYFLRPGDPTVPIIYDVERIRDGSSFATRRVEARQHGRPIYYLTASFQIDEDGFEHQDVMPEAVSVADSIDMAIIVRERVPEQAEAWEQEWAALEIRAAGDSRPGGVIPAVERPSQSRFWVRVKGKMPDDRLVHEAALTYLSDLTLLGSTLVPHRMRVSSEGIQAASLDHTVWFHRPFRADEWMLYDQVSPSASGARGLAIGRLFTESGALVASVAQEGLIRYRGPA